MNKTLCKSLQNIDRPLKICIVTETNKSKEIKCNKVDKIEFLTVISLSVLDRSF